MAIVDGQIRCSVCRQFKPTTDYQPSVVLKGCGTCRDCKYAHKREYEKRNNTKVNAAVKQRRLKNPEQRRQVQRSWYSRNKARHVGYTLKRNYGISRAEYDALLQNQNGACACCGRKGNTNGKRLFVDHCHSTGKIRGILCQRCNSGIGLLGDSAEGVTRALAYLSPEPKPLLSFAF